LALTRSTSETSERRNAPPQRKVIKYTPLVLSLIHERAKRAAKQTDATTVKAIGHFFI
jgi:hypothetical protein